MRRVNVELLRKVSMELNELFKWIDDFEEADKEITEELIRLKKKEKLLDYIGDNYINLEVVDIDLAMECKSLPEDTKRELEQLRANRSVFKEAVRKDL